MAITWVEGFNIYSGTPAAALVQKYQTVSNMSNSSFIAGRFGGRALSMGGEFIRTPDLSDGNCNTWFIGFSFMNSNITSSNDVVVVKLEYLDTPQFLFAFNGAAGAFRAYHGNGILIGSANRNLLRNVWYYVEFKVVLDHGSGSVEFRINNEFAGNFSGLYSSQTSTTSVTYVSLCGTNSGQRYVIDDLYILNNQTSYRGNTSTNIDYLGEIIVQSIYPESNGTTVEWTSTTTNHANKLDDQDGDGSYVYTYVGQSPGEGGHKKELLNFDALEASAVIALQYNLLVRNTSYFGNRTIKPIVRIAGTDYDIGAARDVPDVNYNYLTDILEAKPDTSPWQAEDVSNSEFGFRYIPPD